MVWNDVREFVTNPFTMFSAGIVLGALALSGKFSVTATQILLVVAWAVAVIGLRVQPLAIFAGIALCLAGGLILLAYWFRPEVAPQDFGLLSPRKNVVFSVGGQQLPNANWIRALQIGDSESVLVQISDAKEPILQLPHGAFFELERVDGHLLVSTIVRDR
jgi:hypothetical protein